MQLGQQAEAHDSGHKAHTIWLTGLSGAGKTTIAEALRTYYLTQGAGAAVLDGDILRRGLCADLGFSRIDRSENIRRAAEVAAILNAAGIISIVALISPFREDRFRASEIIGADGFVEVYLSTPLQECERRDVKGLYAKARRGEIPDFTGVSSPYEEPQRPRIAIDTSVVPLAECVLRIVDAVESLI
jgi:adenylyl-sulfate kinase